MIQFLLIYFSIGIVVSIAVALLSRVPTTTKTLMAMCFLAFGWPLVVIYSIHKLFIKISGGEDVVTSDKDNPNSNRSTDSDNSHMESMLNQSKERTQ